MRLSTVSLTLFRFLIPPALIGTVYLYFFPAIVGCDFPEAKSAEAACYFDGANKPAVAAEIAPFRLLALGDPQLEGDTSLPNPAAPLFPGLEKLWRDAGGQGVLGLAGAVKSAGLTTAIEDVPRILNGLRKRVDLWGNDLYLARVYSTIHWWTEPTHTVVLGDLLGSQWIGDDEFRKRSTRFWKTVFRNGVKVPKQVTGVSGRAETLGEDEAWSRRIITVAGNHDIGYAGDIDERRIERFEEAFGSTNWEIRFHLNDSKSSSVAISSPPELRVVVLNSMNLDEPAYKPELQDISRDFLDEQLYQAMPKSAATVILTHIPLHKEAGVCFDAPFFDYFPKDQGGGIREQNHLSPETSSRILDGLCPAGRCNGVILNGHDHEGCDTLHARNAEDKQGGKTWKASPYARNDVKASALREITVRSMMGSYGGNAGLLSAWFDESSGEWKFEYGTCMFGPQQIWWVIYIVDLIVLGLGAVGIVTVVVEEYAQRREKRVCEADATKPKKA